MDYIYSTDKNLSELCLRFANLSNADLSYVNLSGADMQFANLSNANLSNATLTGANLTQADLRGANLTGANLTGANLEDADLGSTDFTGAIGIASKAEEMAEASRILDIIESGKGKLNMIDWHTCDTVHCVAGWSEPDEEYPAQKASLKLPSFAMFFGEDDDKALDLLRQVANGTLSIWNK
jgi:hypothetical protein